MHVISYPYKSRLCTIGTTIPTSSFSFLYLYNYIIIVSDSCIALQYKTGPGQGNLFSSSSSGNSGTILSLKYMYLVTFNLVKVSCRRCVITTNTKYIAERVGNSNMMYYHTGQALKSRYTHRPSHECRIEGGIIIIMVFVVWICMCNSISRFKIFKLTW